MKTTVEIPDDLYKRAKATAAVQGRNVRNLVEEALRLVVDRAGNETSERELRALLKNANGIADSGIEDLSINPDHLSGYSANARRVGKPNPGGD